jgi:hypothetical protein
VIKENTADILVRPASETKSVKPIVKYEVIMRRIDCGAGGRKNKRGRRIGGERCSEVIFA